MADLEKQENINITLPLGMFRKLLYHAGQLSMSIDDLVEEALEKELNVLEHRLKVSSEDQQLYNEMRGEIGNFKE
jgi:hypothetical protein